MLLHSTLEYAASKW